MVTDVAGPNVFGLMHSSSCITSMELLAGVTLRAASNRVVFDDVVWGYSEIRTSSPVLEPATWGLMLASLIGLFGLRGRMLAIR